ncbi:cellulase family glycosylhydrolase [Nocardiopsis lambiniae]|uniref:Endoglucanase n=1 Tax=Nocardiopsis lambiniae TaxID=3075539 RepID=A0ABU2M6C0_9ACTN|nr:cellulase family glycosylhydrolase [Nocardiopsis sp. DSM 44743]MDT0328214.1 cellulase family glycosylhydrolase [Nocardiopsis sp. DSM 44743]
MRTRIALALGAALALVASLFAFSLPAHADTGFRVQDGRLVDAAGNDFLIRGVSHAHTWYTHQTGSFADIKSLGANTVRVVLSSGDRWNENSAADVENVVSLCKANRLVCMLEVHDTTGYGEEGAAATLDEAVDYWLRIQDVLHGEEDHVLVNIGNEPYGNDQGVNQAWAADTIDAIERLRAAGFEHTLVVDAPNWGQDWQGIMRRDAPQVAAADDNTVFSIHMYGVYEQESTVVSYLEHFVNAGLPLIVGEFGHDHSDGNPDEDAIMEHTRRLGLGYVGWSWSGNGGGVEYLDMVEGFDVNRLTPWGERIFHGPDGIGETSVEAPIYGGGGEPTDPPTEEPSEPPTEEPSEPPTDPEGECTAEFRVTNEWSGGFQAEVEVTAHTALTGWVVTWTSPAGQTVAHSWNTDLSTSGGTVTARNVAYNGTVAAGAATTFGLIGNGTAVAPDPACAAA